MPDDREPDNAAFADCCGYDPGEVKKRPALDIAVAFDWNRRGVIVAAGAALAAAGLGPRPVLAQPAGLPRLAWVCPTFPVGSLTDAGPLLFAAFNAELRSLGYVEGKTVAVDRWSGLDYPDRGAFVRAAVASAPDVIFACGWDPIASMLIDDAKTIPIVFTGNDPIANGFVTNLARPGGTVTGIALEPGVEFTGKLLQLIIEAVPLADRVGYLAPSVQWDLVGGTLRAAAAQLKVEVVPVLIEAPYDRPSYERAFASVTAQSLDALVIGWSPENGRMAQLLAELSLAAKLPAIQSWQEFAGYGGLMSYTPDRAALYRRAAQYIVRVLKGEDPGNLPVQQPESFDFTINLQTARALGITLADSILTFATEVIQ